MKYFTLLFTSLLLITTSCVKISSSDGKSGGNGIDFSWNGNEGKGPIKEKTINENFTGIEVSNAIKTEVYKSDVSKVVISAPDDILDFIDAALQDDGSMKIGVKSNSSWKNSISTNKVLVKVYAKNLEKIEANSSGEIFLKNQFSGNEMAAKVSSSGSINGDLQYNKLSLKVSSSGDFLGKIWADVGTIEVSSSGTIKVEGKIQNGDLSASSSGDIYGENLEIKRGTMKASSSGDIKAMVSEKIDASASSSGSIKIKKIGNPAISKSESSSGSVSVK